MPRKRTSRIYWRERGGLRRAYGDFRDYADVGGGQEALIAPGEHSATTDPDVASKLATDRVRHLEELRRGKALLGVSYRATLSEYAAHYLEAKAKAGTVSGKWLERAEMHLRSALAVLDPDNRRDLTVISPRDIRVWLEHLETVDNGRGGKLSASTRRKWLYSLSGLFRYAASEGFVAPGHNPVTALVDKPSDVPRESRWLEVSAAALFLEAARLWEPPPRHPNLSEPIRCGFPLAATFALTGGRRAEVLGLRRRDISFDRMTCTFRRHAARPSLKTRNAERVVPLWPQLESILREYVFGGSGPDLHADRAVSEPDALLFPSPDNPAAMITDTRKLWENIGAGRLEAGRGAVRQR
jgi:integrase